MAPKQNAPGGSPSESKSQKTIFTDPVGFRTRAAIKLLEESQAMQPTAEVEDATSQVAPSSAAESGVDDDGDVPSVRTEELSEGEHSSLKLSLVAQADNETDAAEDTAQQFSNIPAAPIEQLAMNSGESTYVDDTLTVADRAGAPGSEQLDASSEEATHVLWRKSLEVKAVCLCLRGPSSIRETQTVAWTAARVDAMTDQQLQDLVDYEERRRVV